MSGRMFHASIAAIVGRWFSFSRSFTWGLCSAADRIDTIVDLDRSNGLPDLASTAVLAAAAVGAAMLVDARVRRRPARHAAHRRVARGVLTLGRPPTRRRASLSQHGTCSSSGFVVVTIWPPVRSSLSKRSQERRSSSRWPAALLAGLVSRERAGPARPVVRPRPRRRRSRGPNRREGRPRTGRLGARGHSRSGTRRVAAATPPSGHERRATRRRGGLEPGTRVVAVPVRPAGVEAPSRAGPGSATPPASRGPASSIRRAV